MLSIVVPIHNEEANLEPLALEIEAAMAALGSDVREDWELVFVDDGSTDGSLDRLRHLAVERTWMRVLAMPRNQGQSAAMAIGFRAARGLWTATLDGDLQNDPADIPRLLAHALDHGHDVVSGVRARRRDSWSRRVASRLANGVRRRILRDGTHDVGCSLRVCRTALLRQVPAFDGMHRFLPALLAMQGAELAEMPVSHRPRLHGVSKYGISNRLWRGILDLWGVHWLQKRAVSCVAQESVDAQA